jgi:flagellar hook-associated protein 2
MTGIQLTGLASGLDTDAIIQQLMAVEQQPRARITLKQAAAQARQDALKDIQAKLNSLKLAATALRSAATWGDTQDVESSDATKVAARTIAGAGPGGHSVAVTQLARAAQSTYDFTPQVGASTITVNGKDIALADGATLDDAVAAINAGDAGVYAVNVGGRLAISAKTTGAASAAAASGAGVSNGTTLAGVDASFTVDGTSYTRASNVVSDVVAGVELTLKGTTATGSTATITISAPKPDEDLVVSQAKAFVAAYNATVDAIRSRTTEARVPNAATATDAKKGVLFGDTGLNDVLSSLRGAIDLSALGISTGAASATTSQDSLAGKLTLDEPTLRAALDNDPVAVQRTLGGVVGTDGFAQAFEAAITPYTETAGVLDQRVDAAATDLSDLADALTRFDDRMSAKEALLRKRFTALEQALAQNQSTQSSLLSALGQS